MDLSLPCPEFDNILPFSTSSNMNIFVNTFCVFVSLVSSVGIFLERKNYSHSVYAQVLERSYYSKFYALFKSSQFCFSPDTLIFEKTNSFFPLRSICKVSPFLYCPSKILSAKGFCTSFWIVLFKGLAP